MDAGEHLEVVGVFLRCDVVRLGGLVVFRRFVGEDVEESRGEESEM